MATGTARRLPGIRIDAAPAAAAEALPRMDIAVLVGLAATGPLHVPVALDGVAQYAAVFGADAPLAWDATSGERQQAQLGPAVRAFFANGGRRCWVIRVARCAEAEALWREIELDEAQALADVARTGRFALPGLLAVSEAGTATPALAQARCEGSWADPLRVACALAQRALLIDALVFDSPESTQAELHTRQALQVGELLMFGDPTSLCAYALVERVEIDPVASSSWRGTLRLVAAFENAAALSSASPPLTGQITIEGFVDAEPATIALQADGRVALQLDLPQSAPLAAGHWARVSSAGQTLWLRIDSLQQLTQAGSPDATFVTLGGRAWLQLPPPWPAALTGATHAQHLALDIRCDGVGQPQTLAGVGLAPLHAASWWLQRSDAEFHRPSATGRSRAPTSPRFALAAIERPDHAPLSWLPLGVPALFGVATAALPTQFSSLERDGLSRFDEELFLDPALSRDEEGSLLARAEALCMLQPSTRNLFGLHALLHIGDGGLFNEASLLALPDAVHLGWQRATLRTDETPVSEPTAPPQPDFSGFRPCAVPLAAPAAETPTPRPPTLRWQTLDPAALGIAERDRLESSWLRLHRACLRLAAATGDVFAVLALPRHFRSADAVRHADRLRSLRGEPGAEVDAIADARTLSHGALVHPWLIAARTTGGDGPVAQLAAPMPPDGAMVGVMAARAARRGAWIAPANQPLADVVALMPALPEADWQALQDAQVNVIRNDPRGLLALSADTLVRADEAELRPINVRRLLSLLRRLALRLGARWVFEPMGAVLHRAVQRSFDELMTELFRRGAFAGATPASSFRVVTDQTVQSARDADAGRFVIELRVAPSLPMRFIGVRLVQSGERLSVVEAI